MRHVAWRVVAALILALLFFGSAHASRQNIRHCADDYRRFCHQWGLETRGLETVCADMETG